jgi:hypothetical protein
VRGLVGEGEKLELIEEFAGERVDALLGFRLELEGQTKVVDHRSLQKYGAFLGHISQPGQRPAMSGNAGDVFSVEENPSPVRPDEADDDLENRRLAGPVPAEEPDNFARVNSDIDAFHDEACPVAFRDVPGFENRH